MARTLTKLRPDIVHAHLFHAIVAVASVVRRDERRVVTHHHGDYFSVFGPRHRVTLDAWACRRFDRVVAVSDHVANYLRRTHGLDESVVTIRNGWRGRPRRAARNPGEIVCVANLRREKDHITLLRAFAKTMLAVPSARLVLVGAGPLEQELRARAHGLGIAAAIEFAGPAANVWLHLARAELFAIASRVEPLGISIIEAMAAGLPIVATRAGGIPELVTDDVEGRLVDAGDVDAMAMAMTGYLTDPRRRRAAVRAAKARAAGLTMDATIERYLTLYEDLVAR